MVSVQSQLHILSTYLYPTEVSFSFDDHVYNDHYIGSGCHSQGCFTMLEFKTNSFIKMLCLHLEIVGIPIRIQV